MAKRKKTRKPTIVIALVLAVLIVIGAPYIKELVSTTTSDGENVTVVIEKGSSTESIGKVLKENGLIKSVTVFKIRAKLSEDGARMNYGTFTLNTGMCIPDIIKALAGTYAVRPTVTLTVPEGFSIEQIAKRCEELKLCTKEEFFEAEGRFKHNYSADDKVKFELQGYLYPETYEFYSDATADDIIKKLVSQYEKVRKDIKKSDIKVDRSWADIMTIASLIEREALLDSEMKRISGVIYNRLEIGMRLQIDAAVQYAVSDGYYDVKRITYSDLEINSPYNTYKIDALPVGPICNPGINAILAACNPEKHDYLYYHTNTEKNDGSHIFTKTYQEHIATQ